MTPPLLAPFLSRDHDTAAKPAAYPPCWFMRQAGRYLPEYRELRARAGDFLTLCYTPEDASEVTLQPIRRFGMDGAIIFSDILVVPHALGRQLRFIPGEGPQLEPLTLMHEAAMLQTGRMREALAPVYEALARTRAALAEETALIGFAGAPWTLLCYMLDGSSKKDFMAARSAIYHSPALIEALLDILTEAVSIHLSAQIQAGAQLVQLFDSWAGYVPVDKREQLVMAPAKRIIASLKRQHPAVPVIAFPKGLGETGSLAYCVEAQPDGLSVDSYSDMAYLAEHAPEALVLQGNIDPVALIHDVEAACSRVQALRARMHQLGRPYIVNLGHGVLPATPPEHMATLIRAVRGAIPETAYAAAATLQGPASRMHGVA